MASGKAQRAARLSRVPGVTIAAAAKRFGVPLAQVRQAREEVRDVSLSELALACLTGNGKRRGGALGDLSGIAGYLDYVNHDGCTAADVRRLLQDSVREGLLSIAGDRWRLLKPWP